MRIGITERGDAGLDLSWGDKLGQINGVVLITKHITNEFTKKLILLFQNDYPFILHATCTGWGGTALEPNVPTPSQQLAMLKTVIDLGLTPKRTVLRIDPIVPTPEGLDRVESVLWNAHDMGILPNARVRISVLDEYKHVKQRLQDAGIGPFYGPLSFQAPPEMMHALIYKLEDWARAFDITFEACAEPMLRSPYIEQIGCISPKDLAAMNLDMPDGLRHNPQKRGGCLCLSCKTELLTNKSRCPHKCLYCYWHDA